MNKLSQENYGLRIPWDNFKWCIEHSNLIALFLSSSFRSSQSLCYGRNFLFNFYVKMKKNWEHLKWGEAPGMHKLFITVLLKFYSNKTNFSFKKNSWGNKVWPLLNLLWMMPLGYIIRFETSLEWCHSNRKNCREQKWVELIASEINVFIERSQFKVEI